MMSDSESDDIDYIPSDEDKNLSEEENNDEDQELNESRDELYSSENYDTLATSLLLQNEKSHTSDIDLWTNFLQSVGDHQGIQNGLDAAINDIDSPTMQPKIENSTSNDDHSKIANTNVLNQQTVSSPEGSAAIPPSPLQIQLPPIGIMTANDGRADVPSRAVERSPSSDSSGSSEHPPRPAKRSAATALDLSIGNGKLAAPEPNGSSFTDFKSLTTIRKQIKVNTLDMSKDTWDQYKKEECGTAITDDKTDMDIHNKGKEGYLERVDFLNRAGNRRFEIEKNIRNSFRK